MKKEIVFKITKIDKEGTHIECGDKNFTVKSFDDSLRHLTIDIPEQSVGICEVFHMIENCLHRNSIFKDVMKITFTYAEITETLTIEEFYGKTKTAFDRWINEYFKKSK